MSLAIGRCEMNPLPRLPNSQAAGWWTSAMFASAFLVVPLTQPYIATAAGETTTTTAAATHLTWNAGLFVLAATLLVATISDLKQRRIRNYLTYSALAWLIGLSILARIVVSAEASTPSTGWLESSLDGTLSPAATLAGAAACFAVMFMMFILAGTGGGDVKLCTVIGAALGVELGLTAVVVSHIAAGAAVLVWVVVVYGPIQTFGTIGRSVGTMLFPVWIAPPAPSDAKWLKFPLPMSPFFLIGTALTLFLLR